MPDSFNQTMKHPNWEQDPLMTNVMFATDLFHAVAPEKGNVVVSPHSVAISFGLVALGARGETMEAALRVLRLDSPESLRLSIAAEEAAFRSASGDGFQYESDTSIWLRKGFRFLRSFRHEVKQTASAHIARINVNERGRKTINSHVAKVTHDLIPELIKQPLHPDAILVATSALWLKANWTIPFEADRTRQSIFHTPGGDVIVPFLRQTNTFNIIRLCNMDLLLLPYKGDNVDFVVILPHRNISLSDMEKKNWDELARILQNLQLGEMEFVDVSIPRLSLVFENSLSNAIKSMGAEIVFSATADFSGIAESEAPIMLYDIFHSLLLNIDEIGTEAATATSLSGYLGSLDPPRPTLFHIDRPFLFLVRHRKTGAILFLGRVENPAV